MPRCKLRAGLAGAALALGGCTAVYAPPARTPHLGAPARLDPGTMEAGVVSSGQTLPYGFQSGHFGYAASEHVVVQAGLDYAGGEHGMGWGGAQVPARLHLRGKWSLAADGEVGIGAGVGGRNECGDRAGCETDTRRWYQRPAGGTYLGGGGAIRLGPASLYARARGQITAATNVPVTAWASLMGGLHFHIARRADFWLGMASFRYLNRVDAQGGLLAELGLSLRFDPGRLRKG